MSVWRIFSASAGSFSAGRALRSAGEWMAGRSEDTEEKIKTKRSKMKGAEEEAWQRF
jgi:hypothetical protein